MAQRGRKLRVGSASLREVPEVSPGGVAAAFNLVDAVQQYRDDPLGFVLFIFPWGEQGGPLEEHDGPDVWQAEFLEDLGREVRARGADASLGSVLMATASGHGVGKTTLLVWIIIWFMSVHKIPVVTVTANSAGQLSTTTWRELSVWHGYALNRDWFTWTATTFYMKGATERWRATAIPWSKERPEAFQGKHAAHMLMIFDEASKVDDVIWEATEGVLTTRGAIWLVFGNPTRNTGRFRECFRRFRHRWITRHVDAREAKANTNKAQHQAWIEDWGEDSDFVRVRVKGLFPRHAFGQLISEDLVLSAEKEFRRRYGQGVVEKAIADGPEGVAKLAWDEAADEPLVLSLDVSRFGGDQSVLVARRGRTAFVLAKWRELSGPQLAYRVIEWWKALQPDAVFVDQVGEGASCYDTLVDVGYEPVAVSAGRTALDDKMYDNRRIEMWDGVAKWLADGGAILEDRELHDDLIAPEYGFTTRGERKKLESKEDMRARGLPSPDCGDGLAGTFYMPVAPSARRAAAIAKLAKGFRAMHGAGTAAETWMSN